MGPVGVVLLDREINFEIIQRVDELLMSIASGDMERTKSTREFTVSADRLLRVRQSGSDCQFSLQFDNKWKARNGESYVEIKRLTNRGMASSISISAGCNQQGDHNILGELILSVARLLDGLIDYTADLNLYEAGITEQLEGTVYAIEYNDGMAVYQISDAVFLDNWIRHPSFRMVK